jgi:hypothetical protein
MEISIQIEEDVVLQLATYLEKGNNEKDIKENNDLSLGITAVLDFKQFLDNDLDTPENPTVH